ncbi:ATP-binding protein [Streptomyces sp. NHF165]|nr:ATP-binding protein [Streptomyces sp. NHF165]
MTMTAAGTTSIGASRYSRTYPCVPESARRARGLAATALHSWGLEALLDDASVVTSELVSNAVQHSTGHCLIFCIERLTRCRVCVRVTDGSDRRPVLRGPDDEETEGRGLLLVSALADSWGTDVHTSGKTVWADLVRVGRASAGPADHAGAAPPAIR